MSLRSDEDVQRFVEAARRYCVLVEKPQGEPDEWMRVLLSALAELYAAAFRLPSPELEAGEVLTEELTRVPAHELSDLRTRLAEMLDEDDEYLFVFSPVRDKEMTEGYLVEDLVGIYEELRPGVRVWDEGLDDYLHDLIFEWGPMPPMHWGHHALSAMRVLHELTIVI
jgi:hypothetical protein